MASVSEQVRRAVERRAGERCEYCRAPQRVAGYRFHVEHVVPRSHGGVDDLSNLALSCATCNFAKGAVILALDPDSGARVPLFNPRLDRWEEHFAWAPDGNTLLGRMPVGVAMVVALNMNQPVHIAARPLWRQLGLFP
jgi:hypothetical protein